MKKQKKQSQSKKVVDRPLRSLQSRVPFVLDDWQLEVLKAEGNICICSGRQVGKSQVIAIKTAEYIVHNPGKVVLIISITEDQAERMLQKIMLYLDDNYRSKISKGRGRPTKHRVVLTNGAEAITKAVGQYALGVLGMTVDVVVPDECAYLPEAVWTSITPMLLTTGGNLWLLSTPNARSGYFYDAYTDPSLGFKTFHVNSEEVASARPEPMRSMMIDYLAREKERMTELNYAQQYLAQFLEELGQLFSDSLIKEAQVLIRPLQKDFVPSIPFGEFYLGVDVARMGGDEITFEILEKRDDVFLHRENIVHTYSMTTRTIDKILELDVLYNFRGIYIDDGGLGVAVFDQLLIHDQTKRKVIAINNASRSVDKDKNRSKKILKEDLYLNFLNLLERKKIRLLKDSDVAASLKSIVIENTKNKNDVRIYGRYSHIVEGLIRAAWSIRNTHLNIYFERE